MKKVKRVLSSLVAFCMIAMLFPIQAAAINMNCRTDTYCEVEGGKVYFNIINGVCDLVGCDVEVTKAVIPQYIDSFPVESIGPYAFLYCGDITEITLPDSVTFVGEGAFTSCESLQSIFIPSSVNYLGPSVFDYCDSLTDIYYAGTEEQWKSIDKASTFTIPPRTKIHYKYLPPQEQPLPVGEFRFSSNSALSCMAKNTSIDLYVGYYVDDVLYQGSTEYKAAVTNRNIVDVKVGSWDSSYGQKITLNAKKPGKTELTVVDPANGVSGVLEISVVDSKTVYNFNEVPKMTVEPGKTTNFYDYSGMVVDDFKYTAHKDSKGNIDYYNVTMTVYNSLNLYGAVTSYDSEGNVEDYDVINKFTSMPSGFVDSVDSIVKQTGDIFHLLGNDHYYSGESITKRTAVSLRVPVGGHLEISNSLLSPVALFANITGIFVDVAKTTKKLVGASAELSSSDVLVEPVLMEAFSKDYLGDEIINIVKKTVEGELKRGNWNLVSFGSNWRSLLDTLTNSGVNFVELLEKELCSVTGIASIGESFALEVLPTGDLIDFLYGFSNAGELAIEISAFINSAKYPQGMYLYPATFKDVSVDAYYAGPIQWAVINGVTAGTDSKRFSPDIPCTRAQMVTFLWRTAGSPKPLSLSNPFVDVHLDTYYYDAVLWAVENGITGGTSKTTFSPDDTISRAQVVTFLFRFAGSPTVKGGLFGDVPPSAYYADAVRWALEMGITGGTGKNTFSPDDDCTRGQVVTFLYRDMA